MKEQTQIFINSARTRRRNDRLHPGGDYPETFHGAVVADAVREASAELLISCE